LRTEVAAMRAPPWTYETWTFDEGSGNTVTSWSGSAATMSNAAFHTGLIGPQSLHLGDNTHTVQFPAGVGQFGTADFTVSFWFYSAQSQSALLLNNKTIQSVR
jgi:hypothetical protein